MTRSEALRILQLSEGFTQDELKKKYRRMAKEKHPDTVAQGKTEAEKERMVQEFKNIVKAYEILTGKREADSELFGQVNPAKFRRKQPNQQYTHTSIFEFEPVG